MAGTPHPRELDPEGDLSAAQAAWLRALGDPTRAVIHDPINSGQTLRRAPWAIELRTVDWEVWWQVTAGVARLRSADRSWELHPGDACWMPAGSRWGVEPIGRDELGFRYLRFRVDDVPSPLDAITVTPAAWALQSVIAGLVEDLGAMEPGPIAGWRSRAAIIWVATTLWRGQLVGAQGGTSGKGLADHDRDRLRTWLREHRGDRVTPAELAGLLDLSLAHFTRLCKASFGVPPRRWIVTERMRMASLLLEASNHPIGKIAADFGYDDLAGFSRQFKQVMGMSPGAWRRRDGGGQHESAVQ